KRAKHPQTVNSCPCIKALATLHLFTFRALLPYAGQDSPAAELQSGIHGLGASQDDFRGLPSLFGGSLLNH
ncbi:MAG: hypothetical protein AB8F65_01805, partial [Woeseiaceae bacterium]